MTKRAKKITAYKGFNEDWTCKDFQYEVGKSYTHDGPLEIFKSGFHACEHPLDVFNYYAPAGSKFALVELSDETDREGGDDTSVAAAAIEIKAELQIPELVEAAVKHVFDAADWLKKSSATEDCQVSYGVGHGGATYATGYCSAASATGYQGTAMAIGCQGAAMGANGNALFLCERNVEGEITAVWAGIVGQDGIKPGTFYTLRDAKPVELERTNG